MKKLKVLQLASFEGNIGDNANHKGTRALLNQNLGFELEYTNLEIREFYWKVRKYDDEFIALANQHDLVIIGGGNYFELWVDASCTGTSIDISLETLKKIKPPIVFYSLGCDPGQGVTKENLDKFKGFLDYLNTSPKYLISVRNDGSMDTIKKYLGTKYAEKIYKVPDGGFFTEVEDYYHPELPNRSVIAINLAGDMIDLRFNEGEANSKKISYEQFLESFGNLLNKSLNKNPKLHLVFVPHIFRDLNIISDVITNLDDNFCRNRVTVAPYLHGEGAQEYIFDLYRKCKLVMGMRFHANVCPLGLNVPTIGLINYPQIEHLYRELGISYRAIRVNEPGFEIALESSLNDTLNNTDNIQKQYSTIKKGLIDEIAYFHSIMREWLKEFYLNEKYHI